MDAPQAPTLAWEFYHEANAHLVVEQAKAEFHTLSLMERAPFLEASRAAGLAMMEAGKYPLLALHCLLPLFIDSFFFRSCSQRAPSLRRRRTSSSSPKNTLTLPPCILGSHSLS